MAAEGVRASDEEEHAVRERVDHACRAVVVEEREFVINFNFECVCTGVAQEYFSRISDTVDSDVVVLSTRLFSEYEISSCAGKNH